MSDPRRREDAAPARVEALLRESRRAAFAPGFAHRVMRRVHGEPAAFGAVLQRQFLRLATLAAAAVLALAGWNLRGADARQSPVEAALGLPAVTADAALMADASTGEGGG